MATGVSEEQALKWEKKLGYDLSDYLTGGLDLVSPGSLVSHLAKARTKNWNTRREDYIAWVEQRDHDSQRASLQQQWDAQRHLEPGYLPSPVWCGSPEPNADGIFYPDFPSILECETQEIRDLKLWKRRHTIAIVRERRIGLEFHGFMDLPAEIREMIYVHALVKGKIVVPNCADSFATCSTGLPILEHYKPGRFASFRDMKQYQRYEGLDYDLEDWNHRRSILKPLLDGSHSISFEYEVHGLLQGVSRVIHLEAARVFYGRNQLIFPAGTFHEPHGFNSMVHWSSSRVPEWLDYTQLARNVSYTFDTRDLTLSDYECRQLWLGPRRHFNVGGLTPEALRETVHNKKLVSLQSIWVARIEATKFMTLDKLQLSFEECYCGVGCCRQVAWVCNQFTRNDETDVEQLGEDGYWGHSYKVRPPLVIEVLGWLDLAEQTQIEKILKKLEKIYPGHSVQICFVGKSKTELSEVQDAESGDENDVE